MSKPDSGHFEGTKGARATDTSSDTPALTVSPSALEHASVGEFMISSRSYNHPRLIGGGHGQENIDYLLTNGIPFIIAHTLSNGVRLGCIPSHKIKQKRSGMNQSWFPASWTRNDIKLAGEYVASMPTHQTLKDGIPAFGLYKGVRVGIIKTDGNIATVFPDADNQPD